MFSAVSSAFVIDIHSQLQPDPNEQSIALLRAILLTLNQSAIPGETSAVPPIQDKPPSEIVTATTLMYASLLISLLAAFVAMLGKQWLNRYLRNSGGSMIERCGDRQRKCDGIEKWPLHPFIESLPVMLQVSLFLLAWGLCQHMWTINTTVAYTLAALTGLGALLYLVIVISGLSSYACPFQTPVSTALRRPLKKLLQITASILRPPSKKLLQITASVIAQCGHALSWARRVLNRSPQSSTRRPPLHLSPLVEVQVQPPEPWLESEKLAIIRRENADDARCVSWVLRNITDPEALDAAIRLAGTVQWFKDGTDVEPLYDVIVSSFRGCFDSNGRVHPGSTDRAYYSGRAIVWIRALARCKSQGFASRFPFHFDDYTAPVSDRDCDLVHLLGIRETNTQGLFLFGDHWTSYHYIGNKIYHLLGVGPGHTPSHLQWISNLLLHETWANRARLSVQEPYVSGGGVSLNELLNRLLVWCIYLGSPIDEDVLRVQDKSYDIPRFHHPSCSCSIPLAIY